MVDVPETRYAHAEQGNIAFQVIGDGPISVVFVGDWWNHVEWQWEEPHHARFLTRLASFSRLILFDKRGTGLSDRFGWTSSRASSSGWTTSRL